MPSSRRRSAAWLTHPGEVLREEFLKPLDLSSYALAKAIGVTPQRVNDIKLKKTGVSADMALLFARFFGTSAEFWLNLQQAYLLGVAEKRLARRIQKIKPRTSSAA